VNDFLKKIADFSPRRLALLAAELDERVRTIELGLRAPIAIVGIGCRFPGGIRDAQTYWELLREGRDAIIEVPQWRWDVNELYDPDPHAVGRVASRWGGFLDAPEFFDPAFFGIAPVEAESMDPQQRLLLEVAWEALEDAAIDPATLAGSRTGVYIGLCNSDYAHRVLLHTGHGIDAWFAQGASHAVASGRISYFLGLRGPSISVDTACSSSLVAIHQACQSLRLNETELALAGGVNLLFSPEVTMALSRAQMMASDGRCKAFSAEADGFVRSEGCGVVVLRRLDDALRNGDCIVAVIRGTAVNQDGRSSGITAPNGPSQEDVIRAALADAGVSPRSVGYVEAHGTGTQLGDPIELRALDAALGAGRSEETRLIVGSVKSNFGHAESAAGVAGLIKLALALKHREIPGSLHFVRPNPEVDWQNSHLRVPVHTEPWLPLAEESLRIGSVSSFGFSGTNAHLVLSEAPEEFADDAAPSGADESCVVPLSARSDKALQRMAARLADRLREDSTLCLRDVAYTLSIGRAAFSHRAAICANSKSGLIEDLTLLAEGEVTDEAGICRGLVESRNPHVAFLFAGQGGERTGMGLSLLKHSPVFRAAVAEVDTALTGVISASIEAIFRNRHDELSQSGLVQPALYAFQYGLARVWQNWGVEPHIVVGHSMGEILACTLAGVMTVQDAARLIAARGRLTGELGDPGGMVAVAASENRVLAGLDGYEADVSIAAINGSGAVVISGRSEPLELATQGFERAGIRVKRLNITYGSHSPAMHRVLPAFYNEALKVQYHAPRLPILADLTGEMVDNTATFNAQYFTDHLSRPVQFRRCLDRLAKEGCGVCIEMGPRAVLTAFGKERGEPNTRWIASANGREDDLYALQSALAEAFVAGAPLDWQTIFRDSHARKVALPTYPFERERYWIAEEDSAKSGSAAMRRRTERLSGFGVGSENQMLTGLRIDASVPIFERELASPLPWSLGEHRIGEHVILPASVYLSLAWNAFRSTQSSGALANIAGLEIIRPLQPDGNAVVLQTALATSGIGDLPTSFRISSRRLNENCWTLHAAGRFESDADVNAEGVPVPFDREASRRIGGEEFYRLLDERGVHLGNSFRAVKEIWFLSGSAVARVVANDSVHIFQDASVGPHPALFDACFQVLGAAALAEGDMQLRLMTGIEKASLYGELRGEMFVEAHLRHGNGGSLDGSIRIRSTDGILLASVSDIRLRTISAEGSATESGEGWLYEQTWQSAPLRAGINQSEVIGKWIVIGSETGLARRVVEQMTTLGQSARIVKDPLGIEDSKSRIADLRAIELEADSLLPSSYDIDGPDISPEAVSQHAAALAEASLDAWRQVLKTEGTLSIFTEGVHTGGKGSALSGAMQAALWGLARCATLEHPQRLQRIVDLDPNATLEEKSSIVVHELLSHDSEEQIIYIGSERKAFRLKPAEPRTPDLFPAVEILRKDVSYLLTGGVGGLGVRVAAWLGRQGAGHLILTTRSQASVVARQKEIDDLRASGVMLTIVHADVADPAAMKELFQRFGNSDDLPPLRGVIHMAADLSSAPLEKITTAQIESMFRAKVAGTWLLHQLTRDLPLDFFAAFSSMAAVLGASGLGHYAAANSFADNIVALRAAENLPFTSIAWGTWETMRLASKETQQQYSSGGMLPMQDDAALAWLGHALRNRRLRRPAVANVNWELLAPLYETRRARNWLEYVRPRESAQGAKPLWTAEPGESRLHALERVVQKEAARVLGFRGGKVPLSNARLADLGLDSLMAVNLRNRLQTLIGQGLSPTFAFEYPTPVQMAMALDMLLWSAGVTDEESSGAERDEIQI
jgi:acyl transferase domain-containing protein